MSHAKDMLVLVDRLAEEGGCTDDCPHLSCIWTAAPTLVFTHGNPEHRYLVDLFTIAHPDDWGRGVVDWLLRLHAYEAGVPEYERCGVPE